MIQMTLPTLVICEGNIQFKPPLAGIDDVRSLVVKSPQYSELFLQNRVTHRPAKEYYVKLAL